MSGSLKKYEAYFTIVEAQQRLHELRNDSKNAVLVEVNDKTGHRTFWRVEYEL